MKGYGCQFLIIYIEDKIDHTAADKLQIGDGKDQVGHGGGVSPTLYIHMTGNGFHAQFPVQIHGFNPEAMIREFPQIKAYPYYHRKLGMYAGETFGDYRIKGSYNGQFSPIVLGKVTKGKKFCFHV
jgi:hypothetical protein